MGSSGAQRRHLQRWQPGMKPLAVSSGAGETTGTIRFRVPVPDSRLRVKVTVAFAFRANSQPPLSPPIDLSPGGATLWLAEADDDDSGATGTTYPAVNIEGSQAAPTAIPLATGLTAYSREFETAGDNIEGLFSSNNNGFAGTWVLQLRYQPAAGQRFTDQEWEEIKGLCRPIVPPPVNLG